MCSGYVALGPLYPCSLFLASLFSSIPLSDVTFFFFLTSPSLRQDLGLIHLFNYGNNNNSLIFKVIITYWALC